MTASTEVVCRAIWVPTCLAAGHRGIILLSSARKSAMCGLCQASRKGKLGCLIACANGMSSGDVDVMSLGECVYVDIVTVAANHPYIHHKRICVREAMIHASFSSGVHARTVIWMHVEACSSGVQARTVIWMHVVSFFKWGTGPYCDSDACGKLFQVGNMPVL